MKREEVGSCFQGFQEDLRICDCRAQLMGEVGTGLGREGGREGGKALHSRRAQVVYWLVFILLQVFAGWLRENLNRVENQ